MVDTESALLAAIVARPHDDTPRLMYADWLEETAETDAYQGYAEFIRLQCEISQSTTELPAQRERVLELWGQYPDKGDIRSRFHRAVPPVPGGWAILPDEVPAAEYYSSFVRAAVRRGFLAEVHALLDTFIRSCHGCIEPGERDQGDIRCRLCHGAGLVVTDAARVLFRSHPIETVRATDREPYHDGSWYAWFNADRDYPAEVTPIAANLPRNLFAKLERIERSDRPIAQRWVAYRTADAAHAALSAAIIAMCRG